MCTSYLIFAAQQCPDGGESGNELAEYEGAGYPTQESSK